VARAAVSDPTIKRLWNALTNGWVGLVSSVVVGSVIVWLILDEHGRKFTGTVLSWVEDELKWSVAWVAPAWAWFTGPVTMPVYRFIGWLTLMAVLAFAAALLLTGLAFRYTSWRRLVAPKQPRFDAIDSGTLTDEDQTILQFVASGQGQAVSLQMIAGRFQWHTRIAERMVDRLAEAGFLKFTQGYGGTGIELSDGGIDYAVSRGWLTIKRPTLT
jgi:hypothetical protein